MNEESIAKLLQEIKSEQQISPFLEDSPILNYIKEAEQDINYNCGYLIDYDDDLEARSLLKNYVLYANHKRLSEFKSLYIGDYVKLQRKYYINSNLH